MRTSSLMCGASTTRVKGTTHSTHPPHKIHSRIDYFLIPHSQLHAVKNSTIGLRTWSDHAPIMLTYALSDISTHKTPFWRLNESLLQRPEVLEEVNRELTGYFRTNTTADCTPGSVWEAHREVIRGIFIKHGAQIKRENGKQLELLLNKLHITASQHKNSPDPLVEAELNSTRSQINDLLGYRAKAALQRCRLTTYESGDKCGRILARAVKDLKMKTYIPHIKTITDTKVSLPRQIANSFKEYYETLYSLPSVPRAQSRMEAYVSSSQIPTLTPENIADLDSPITQEELTLALKSAKPDKAPGPDGLTLPYYKTLFSSLNTHMISFFNAIGPQTAFSNDTT